MKIGYFITARLKSSRLKQKIILDLNNKTVLDRVIERCKKVSGIDDIVLCTSTNSQDSVLYDFALNNEIKFYPGSENDVLERLYDAAKYYGFDAFLSITADNPLHSFHIGSLVVDWFKKGSFDFIFTEGFPLGTAPYFIKTSALEVAIKMKKEGDTEIWGPFVNRPDFFNIGYLTFKNIISWPVDRLTCDYAEDYELFRNLYSNFPEHYVPSIFEIRQLMSKNPDVLNHNKRIVQKGLDSETLEKINANFNAQIELGIRYAKDNNIDLCPKKSTLEIEI